MTTRLLALLASVSAPLLVGCFGGGGGDDGDDGAPPITRRSRSAILPKRNAVHAQHNSPTEIKTKPPAGYDSPATTFCFVICRFPKMRTHHERPRCPEDNTPQGKPRLSWAG